MAVTVVEVEYHPVALIPPEYCEYLPPAEFERCLPWLVENKPQEWLVANCANYEKFFAEEKTPEVLEKLASLSISGAKGAKEGDVVKKLPGGKVKKKEKPEIILERQVRNKRKCITIVKGLDTFGVKLADASKKFGKRFACGSSVVKGNAGDKEQIDIQGDFQDEIGDLILETWSSCNITGKDIFFWEAGKKVPSGL